MYSAAAMPAQFNRHSAGMIAFIGNKPVSRILKQLQPEVLAEVKAIVQTVSMDQQRQ